MFLQLYRTNILQQILHKKMKWNNNEVNSDDGLDQALIRPAEPEEMILIVVK